MFDTQEPMDRDILGNRELNGWGNLAHDNVHGVGDVNSFGVGGSFVGDDQGILGALVEWLFG